MDVDVGFEKNKFLTAQDIAKIAGVSVNTAYEWFRRRDFPKVPDERIKKISSTAFNFWIMGINYPEMIRKAVEKEVAKDFRM